MSEILSVKHQTLLSGLESNSNQLIQSTVRATDDLPQTGTLPIFTITPGVAILGIYGEVKTTQIENQTCKLGVNYEADSLGAAVDLSIPAAGAALDIANDIVGVAYSVPGEAGTILEENAGQGCRWFDRPLIMANAGAIQIVTSASNTGKIEWTLWYRLLNSTGVVTATAL